MSITLNIFFFSFSNYRLDINQKDPVWTNNTILRINGTGHVIHAFVNGEHIGNVTHAI